LPIGANPNVFSDRLPGREAILVGAGKFWATKATKMAVFAV
jgi:hypothetical protein